MLVHVVLFWLKPGTSDADRKQLEADGVGMLKGIPSVRHIWSGRPAMTPRDVVDNSYDVGLCVVYDDKSGLDLYQSHELHTAFLQKHKTNFQRVQVYDFLR